MLNDLFMTIHQWMSGSFEVALLGCFLWGMISVLLSPCHMASIPLIVGYVAGQDHQVQTKNGVGYAVCFTAGLFITIAALGVVCSLMGRMMGDISPYWTLLIGGILLWVAMDMMGVSACNMPGGGIMSKIKVNGYSGAFILGLAYGILSGSCTFGFIAPILAIITVQEKIITGMILIILFATGHCLPIAIAGSSTAFVKRLIENKTVASSSIWFKKLAGLAIAGLGIYFIVKPFVEPALY